VGRPSPAKHKGGNATAGRVPAPPRRPPTRSDNRTWGPGSSLRRKVADATSPTARTSRPRHAHREAASPWSNGCSPELPPTPARISPPEAFLGLSPIRQAKTGGSQPRSGCGASILPAVFQAGGRKQGLRKGRSPGPPPPQHSPWRLPRACSKQHPPRADTPVIR
jgi:hypothetical protein